MLDPLRVDSDASTRRSQRVRGSRLTSIGFVALAVAAPSLRAQCTTQWLPGFDIPGTNGSVYATTLWDPPGPATSVLVIGGNFTSIGPLAATNLAVYDPATGRLSTLGSGMGTDPTNAVRAFATLPNGNLVAAGFFFSAGGVSVFNIAQWNGTTWSPLGSGIVPASGINALAVLPNGTLVAAGSFSSAGMGNIRQWNGTTWSGLGSGTSGSVSALAVMPNGDLVAGGHFTMAGGVSADCIARWNGTTWSPLGTGTGYSVLALCTMPNGDLIAGGNFGSVGGMLATIARWNGTSWSSLSTHQVGSWRLTALHVRPNGDLLAGGLFTNIHGVPANRVARWNGSSWSAFGSGLGAGIGGTDLSVFTLATLPNGDLFAGGIFPTAGNVGAENCATWNGTAWSPFVVGTGTNAAVHTIVTLPNGDQIAGGSFTSAGGVPASRIARRSGASWSPLGSGLTGGYFSVGPFVNAMTLLPNGDVVAGGMFTTAGGTPATNVARWNGTAWSALGAGLSGPGGAEQVYSLATMANGDVVAAGLFSTSGGANVANVARWNGTSWSSVGTGLGIAANVVTVLPDGDLVAGGRDLFFNNIARWNGTWWLSLGAGCNGTVHSLATLPNGELLVGGGFSTAGGVPATSIARWNGTAWSALGTGIAPGPPYTVVKAIGLLPNGDVLAGGTFQPTGPGTSHISRWNGTTWSPIGAALGGPVQAIAMDNDGNVLAGGSFAGRYLADLATNCPATTASYGSACATPTGPMHLASTAQPWVGGTFRSVCTGAPGFAPGFSLVGLTATNTPLSSLHPVGGSGCNLLVSPDVAELSLAIAGAWSWQFAIPSNTAFVGVMLHHQVLQVAFDASFQITGLYASNGLLLTVGAF